MGTIAVVILMFMTPGVVLGMISSGRRGFAFADIVLGARYWLMAWLLLVCISVLL
jgi:hypothetical protein